MKKLDPAVRRSIIMLALGLVALAAFYIPKQVAKHRRERFAEPLFTHSLPAGAELVYSTVSTDDDGGTTATVVLLSEQTAERLREHYADVAYPPASDGEAVTLGVKAVDQDSLAALMSGGAVSSADGSYWFIYIYSAKPAES